jgi:hypothetical protein
MLFSIQGKLTYDSEEDSARLFELFTNWSPPEGIDIKEMYQYAEDSGTLIIAEVQSPAAMYEALSPFNPYVSFDVKPLLAMDKMVELGQRALDWRKTVGG